MTLDEILDIAGRVGCEQSRALLAPPIVKHVAFSTKQLQAFAEAIRQSALEEAAKLAEAEPRVWNFNAPDPQKRIATKIRQLAAQADKRPEGEKT